jgi:hypothetical protein
VDARDISSNNGEIPEETYLEQLQQRGRNKLAEHAITKAFEGRAETLRGFTYGKDFFMGDVVQITNEYGVESASRVTEIVMSHDVKGAEVFPTFTTIEEKGY